MAKQKFTHFIPRDKPPKRGAGKHKKKKNKHEKRQKKQNFGGQISGGLISWGLYFHESNFQGSFFRYPLGDTR